MDQTMQSKLSRILQKDIYLEQGPGLPWHKAIKVIVPSPQIYYEIIAQFPFSEVRSAFK